MNEPSPLKQPHPEIFKIFTTVGGFILLFLFAVAGNLLVNDAHSKKGEKTIKSQSMRLQSSKVVLQ